jgi:adenylate cyclase
MVSAGLSLARFFSPLDRGIGDLLLKIKTERHPMELNPRIIPVDLNDASVEELGEALDSRRAFAGLLQVFADCSSTAVLDFIFKNSTGASPEDAELIRAAAGVRRLILAVIPVPEKLANVSHGDPDERSRAILAKNLWHIKEMGAGSIPPARSFIVSFPEFSETASALGHIGLEHDMDGVYRKTPLFYRWEDGLMPSLALAAAVMELGVDPSAIEFHPGKALILPLGEGEAPVKIPVDNAAYVRIPYTARWTDSLYRVSFADVVKARYDDHLFEKLFDELSGGICLAADTSTYKQDFGVTPAEAVYPRSGIYHTVMSGILNNSFYYDLGPGLKMLLFFVFGAAALILSLSKRDAVFNAGFLLLFFMVGGLIYALWRFFSIVPWYGTPAFCVFLCWSGGFIFRQFSRYREQLLFKNALSRYFPRSLAERICAEGRIDLAPAYKELSILFADIASFTKWSADREPEIVHAFLSDYLESMAAVIFSHGGTIDKYIGDGILAFFGDPVEQEDHADRAVRAAVAMQKKIAGLRAFWMPRIGMDLKVRIGVNTGKVIAGNLGTKTRIEYTVIGAAVNLGQRMENSAPPGGVLISGNTRRMIQGPVRLGGGRRIAVKGYDEPIECYEVLFDMPSKD